MIRVNENYIIDVDDLSYTARYDKHTVTVDKKTGESRPVYDLVGYYSTLEGALLRIKEDMNRRKLSSNEYTLPEAIMELRQIAKEFEKTMTKCLEEN